MTLLMLALFLSWPFHSKVDKVFVGDVTAELKADALRVGDYQHNPPMLSTPQADALYVQRAETDIAIAMAQLHRYEHGHAPKQDVETAMSQLSRDLEDYPPPSESFDPRDKS